MKKRTKTLLICLAIPLAVGGLSALLSGGMSDYRQLNQPPLSPPGWVFPTSRAVPSPIPMPLRKDLTASNVWLSAN